MSGDGMNDCERCGMPHDHTTATCCSSHEKVLCHDCYKRTHFVGTPCHPKCMRGSCLRVEDLVTR